MHVQERLLFNSDGDSVTLSYFDPPITPRQLCRPVDELAGTGVDVFIHCLNRGDDTFSHRTQVGGTCGESVTEWEVPASRRCHPDRERFKKAILAGKRQADNTRAILDAGLDPIDILSRRTHELGMRFWVSLRMNDIHEDDSRRFFSHRSLFKINHPELLIGSPYPDPGQGYPIDNFTWAFDFAHDAVREHKLAIIEEACRNYDLDGFELDFQRGPWFFKPGCKENGVATMTDFVRTVRRRTSTIARDRDRPFTLAIRVPPAFRQALARGLDVATWIAEELVDVVVAMDNGYLDMTADIREVIAAARNTSCRIAGGLEANTRNYAHGYGAMYRAAASALTFQGVDALYLFNYDCHRVNGVAGGYTDDELTTLSELADPHAVAAGNKHYIVTCDTAMRTPHQGGTKQLPVAMEPGEDMCSIHFIVGDDPEQAKSLTLRITASAPIACALNNTKIEPVNDWSPLVFENAPVVEGDNTLKIRSTTTPCRVEGVELFIDYA